MKTSSTSNRDSRRCDGAKGSLLNADSPLLLGMPAAVRDNDAFGGRIQQANDEAVVLEDAAVRHITLLFVGIDSRDDNPFPNFFIPWSGLDAAFARSAVGGENSGLEAWLVDGNAA